MKGLNLSSTTVTNAGIIILVIIALYFTNSLWSFLGLFFLQSSKIPTNCPKCNHEFIAVRKDEKLDD